MPGERSDLGGAVRRSLEMSLSRMHLDRVDVFQLHNQVEADEPISPRRLTLREVTGPRGVLEAMHKLKEEGLVGAIGVTGIARHDAVRQLLEDTRLATVQLVTNVLCSEGEMGARGDTPYRDHLAMVKRASAAGLGVFGIRPFAAGSLTSGIDRQLPDDHPVAVDFGLAQRELGFLTSETAGSMAIAAMRYALTVPGVSTVVTGAKNRVELAEAVQAANSGPLPAAIMERIASWQKSRATANVVTV